VCGRYTLTASDPAALRALRQSNPARLLARSTQEVLA